MKKRKETLNELIRQKMQSLDTDGKNGTRNNYRTLLHYIETHYGIVWMEEVNPTFAKRMKKDMESEGKSPATIYNYFAMLTAIFNYAVYKGYASMDNYPVRKATYELDKPAKPKPTKRTDWFLTKEQMQTLYVEWEKITKPAKKRNVGLFLASYLCNGANFADLMRLRYNSDYWRSGEKIFTFVRKKTQGRSDAKVTVPIIPQLKNILDAIAEKPTKNGLVFKFFLGDTDIDDSDQLDKRVMYLNSHISKLLLGFCKKKNITDHVSVTYARHTYATVSTMEGVPYYVVERNLGHSLGGVTENYIGHAQVEDLFRYNALLL